MGSTCNIPLSISQEIILFSSELGQSPNHILQMDIQGCPDTQQLAESIQEFVRRNETLALRLTVDESGSPTINRSKNNDIELIQIDRCNGHFDCVEFIENKISRQDHNKPIDLTLVKFDHHVSIYIAVSRLLCDERSLRLLAKRLMDFYYTGEYEKSSEIQRKMEEYVKWQQNSYGRWKETNHEYSYCKFPFEGVNETEDQHSASKHCFALDSEIFGSLKNRIEKSGYSVETVLFSIFNMLIFKYTKSNELSLGFYRDNENYNKLLFVMDSLFVVNSSLSNDLTFSELLQQLDGAITGVMENKPTFDVMFDLVNGVNKPKVKYAFKYLSHTGNEYKVNYEIWSGNIHDVLLTCEDAGNEMLCELRYNPNILNLDSMTMLADQFKKLSKAISLLSDKPIKAFISVDDSEKTLFQKWNSTTMTISDKSVYQLFMEQAAIFPNKDCVYYNERKINYGELDALVNDYAVELLRYDIAPAKRVVVCLDKSIKMIAVVLAVMKIGATYIPLDPEYPRHRTKYIVEDCGANLIITSQQYRNHFDCAETDIYIVGNSLDQKEEDSTHSNRSVDSFHDTNRDAIQYIIYTSGSTGDPKGVSISTISTVNFLESMKKKLAVSSNDKFIALTTFTFDIAFLELFLPLIIGGSVTLVPKNIARDGELLAALVKESETTVIQATPTTWNILLSSGWRGNREKLTILVGGETLKNELAKKLIDNCKTLWNMYGPTETTVWSTMYQLNESGVVSTLIPIGRPINNTKIYILDEQLEQVSPGVVGNLFIGGLGVTKGYMNKPALNDASIIKDPFCGKDGEWIYKTGDLAHFQMNGDIIFHGRNDFQVKINGFRIELNEIESFLNAHESIEQSVVISIADDHSANKLVAYIVTKDQSLSPQSLRAFLISRIPVFMIPSLFVKIDDLPLTPNLKIDRKRLPIPSESNIIANATKSSPLSLVQFKLVEVWKTILNIELCIKDNIFEMGANSLAITQAVSLIRKVFPDSSINTITLFKHNSVEKLAAIIEREMDKNDSVVLLQDGDRGIKPLFILHTSNGSLDNYIDFLIELDYPGTCYGLRYIGEKHNNTECNLNNLAEYYTNEIRKIQHEGPYFLVGYSFGGNLILEIAKILNQHRERSYLIMIDAVNENDVNLLNEAYYWQAMYGDTIHIAQADYFDNNGAERIYRTLLSENKLPAYYLHKDEQEVLRLIVAKKRLIQMGIRNDYTVFSGEVLFFRAANQSGTLTDLLGWDGILVGDVRSYVIEGDHHTVMKRPGVTEIIKVIKLTLERWYDECLV